MIRNTFRSLHSLCSCTTCCLEIHKNLSTYVCGSSFGRDRACNWIINSSLSSQWRDSASFATSCDVIPFSNKLQSCLTWIINEKRVFTLCGCIGINCNFIHDVKRLTLFCFHWYFVMATVKCSTLVGYRGFRIARLFRSLQNQNPDSKHQLSFTRFVALNLTLGCNFVRAKHCVSLRLISESVTIGDDCNERQFWISIRPEMTQSLDERWVCFDFQWGVLSRIRSQSWRMKTWKC